MSTTTAIASQRRRLALPVRLGLALGLLAMSVAYGASPWLRGQMAESFSHRPTRFTALSFTDHATLPRNLARLGPIPFSFTITNHEGHRVAYRFKVVGIGPNGPEAGPDASVTVSDNHSLVRTVEFVPSQPKAAYTITVELVGRPEFIHFTAGS